MVWYCVWNASTKSIIWELLFITIFQYFSVFLSDDVVLRVERFYEVDYLRNHNMLIMIFFLEFPKMRGSFVLHFDK